MGLIQSQSEQEDRRPNDWAYKAAFDRKDLPSLEEMARHIRETHDTAMIEDFNRKCEQKLRGEETVMLDNGLELKTVTKTGDLVVNTGLRHCINIILGTLSSRWSHFGMSPDSAPAAAITDTALNTDNVSFRVSLAWAESSGMRMFFGGISSQTSGNSPGAVAEIGVYNGSAIGAILLNHSTFPTDAPQQQTPASSGVSSAPVLVSAVIEFCPIA